MPCNLCISYVYIPNSLHLAQLQKKKLNEKFQMSSKVD